MNAEQIIPATLAILLGVPILCDILSSRGKTRIVKIEHPHAKTRFEIQIEVSSWLFGKSWIPANDGRDYSGCHYASSPQNSFDTLAEAESNRWQFEAPAPRKETVVG